MLRLRRLKTYSKEIRRNGRTGMAEVKALDCKRENQIYEIDIPATGYILKPNEIYIAEVSDPGSEAYMEDNFVDELTTLGVSCRIVKDDCIMTVQRPVRIYKDNPMFYED